MAEFGPQSLACYLGIAAILFAAGVLAITTRRNAIGVLVGLEIPLLMRILKDELDFKELVSRVLALDYVGALVASLLFPIFLVPRLGLNRTSLLFGLMNAGVAIWATRFSSASTVRMALGP